jgi:hypothetical protein
MTAPRRKRPRDPAQLAKLIVDIATGEVEDRDPTPEEQGKNPMAVKLGRKGGLKGGEARSRALTPSRRSEIARAAANSRWKKSATTE